MTLLTSKASWSLTRLLLVSLTSVSSLPPSSQICLPTRFQSNSESQTKHDTSLLKRKQTQVLLYDISRSILLSNITFVCAFTLPSSHFPVLRSVLEPHQEFYHSHNMLYGMCLGASLMLFPLSQMLFPICLLEERACLTIRPLKTWQIWILRGWFFILVSPLTQPFHINWKQELISISLCCTCGFVRGQLPHLHSFPTKFFPQKFYLQGWLLSFCSRDLSVATREGGFFSAVKKLMLASLINCLQAYLACRERTHRTDGCKHQALHFPHHQFNYCSFWKIINWHLF